MTIHFLALWWIIVSVTGCVYTAWNFSLALGDYRILRHRQERASMLTAAFTPVRTHGLMLMMHLTFILMGLIAVQIPVSAAAPALPITLYGWLLNLILLAIPHMLIVISYTIHADREKATRLASSGE